MEQVAGHNIWSTLEDILLVLAISGLVIPLLQKIKVSPVLGYLLCGLLIGPYGFGQLTYSYPALSAFFITDTDMIAILAELGVVFLLFMIGLELTLSKLWALRKMVLGLGSAQIMITGLIIFAIALQFNNNVPTSILVGAAFALSSTAMVMQVLYERHMISRPVGRTCFSVLLMQDLAVVPILVLVGAFSVTADTSESSTLLLVAKALITAILVIAAMFAIGKLCLRPLFRLIGKAQNVEWLFALSLFLVMIAALTTHSFGLSAALGAFLAGLIIGETEYRHEIHVITEPVKGILIGIFFLSVGMEVNLGEVVQHAFWLPIAVIGIFAIKAIVFFPIARLFSVPRAEAAHASVMLAQCGEFAFIVIGLAYVGGLLPEEDSQFFLLVATTSLLVTPLATKLGPLAERWATPKKADGENKSAEDILPNDEEGHIIIAGFGRIGQTIATVLEGQKIPYTAIDNTHEDVQKFRKQGYPVIYGNASQIDLWRNLNTDKARAVVVTINDFSMAKKIVRILHKEWPNLPIIVRVRELKRHEEFYEAGATAVIPELLESALTIVRKLLENIGVERDEAHNIVGKYHQQLVDLS